MLTGTNLKYTKAYNYRIVLETIRLFAPLSRADVARRTSLTAQTVSNITRELIGASLVREADKRQKGRGAPSITLEIDPTGAYSIGLDLDRDHLTGVLVDLSGAVQQRVHYELNFPSPDEAVELMTETIRCLADRQGLALREVSGIGVGFPGPIEVTDDRVVNPKAFPGWERVPIVDRLTAHIDLPVFLENNATAAAVGERWYGAGQHIPTFFYLLFGVGLGGGIIINGHPYEGHTGNAGELGYIPAPPNDARSEDGPPAHIGEDYHLPRLYERLREAGWAVGAPADLTAPFEARDAVMLDWIDTVTGHLAGLLVSIEYLIDPEVIFFGGRLPEPIIQEIMDRLEECVPGLRAGGKTVTPRLSQATAGEDAAALGVATLPIYEFFAPAPSLLMKNKENHDGSPLTKHLSL